MIPSCKALTVSMLSGCTRLGTRTQQDGRVGHETSRPDASDKGQRRSFTPLNSQAIHWWHWPGTQDSNWTCEPSINSSYCYCHRHTSSIHIHRHTHTHISVSFLRTVRGLLCILNTHKTCLRGPKDDSGRTWVFRENSKKMESRPFCVPVTFITPYLSVRVGQAVCRERDFGSYLEWDEHHQSITGH